MYTLKFHFHSVMETVSPSFQFSLTSEFLWLRAGPRWWWGWENVLLFMTGAGTDHAPLALSDHCLQSFSFPICRSLINRPGRVYWPKLKQDLSGANTSKEWVDHGALNIQTLAEWFCLVTTWPWSSQCWGRLEDYWPRMMRTLLMLVTALKLPSSSHQWALRAQHCILIVRICTKNAIYQESTCSEW